MTRMTIDRAVEWAYREELPKSRMMADGGVFGRGIVNVSQGFKDMATLGILPDNAYGVVVDPYAVDEPAPEALIIHEAVQRLTDCDVVIPDDWEWDAGHDFGPCQGAIFGRVAAMLTAIDGEALGVLIRRVAILGPLDCVVDACEVVAETTRNGMPKWYRKAQVTRPTIDGGEVLTEFEVDGYDPKAKRPYDNAYRKYKVEPDPTEALINRAQMELWRAAMDAIADDLGSQVGNVEIEPCRLPARPWEAARPVVFTAPHPAPPNGLVIRRQQRRVSA